MSETRKRDTNLNPNDPTLVRFCRHMVTILAETSVSGFPHDSGSGFVVEFNRKWWLVTAGHVLDGDNGLRAVRSQGYLRGLYACDAWCGNDGTGRPVIIPRDFVDRWHVIGTDENPPDIAVLELGDNLAENLRRGKIDASPETEWLKPPGGGMCND